MKNHWFFTQKKCIQDSYNWMFIKKTYVRFKWIYLKGCKKMLGFLDEKKWLFHEEEKQTIRCNLMP